MTISRRHALAGAGAVATAMALPREARAQSSELVVGTWGGGYGSMLQSEIDEALMKPLGISVSQEVANNDPRRTKLIAEKDAAQSSIDVACINDIDAFTLTQKGVLETIPEELVPRLAEVLPVLRKPTTVPHLYSVFVVLYNPKKVPVPPKGYDDLFEPAYAGRVGFSDTAYNLNVAAANIGAGGSMNDFQPGLKALRELKKSGPKLFPSNEALGAALKNEEVYISVLSLARAFMWKKGGMPIAWSVPDEGAIPVLFEAAVPKNARNKDAAWKYLNAMLDPKAQVAFAEKMGYVPTIRDAQMPEELAREISLTEAQQAQLRLLDYGYMQSERGAILDFWNKEFKA